MYVVIALFFACVGIWALFIYNTKYHKFLNYTFDYFFWVAIIFCTAGLWPVAVPIMLIFGSAFAIGKGLQILIERETKND